MNQPRPVGGVLGGLWVLFCLVLLYKFGEQLLLAIPQVGQDICLESIACIVLLVILCASAVFGIFLGVMIAFDQNF